MFAISSVRRIFFIYLLDCCFGKITVYFFCVLRVIHWNDTDIKIFQFNSAKEIVFQEAIWGKQIWIEYSGNFGFHFQEQSLVEF